MFPRPMPTKRFRSVLCHPPSSEAANPVWRLQLRCDGPLPRQDLNPRVRRQFRQGAGKVIRFGMAKGQLRQAKTGVLKIRRPHIPLNKRRKNPIEGQIPVLGDGHPPPIRATREGKDMARARKPADQSIQIGRPQNPVAETRLSLAGIQIVPACAVRGWGVRIDCDDLHVLGRSQPRQTIVRRHSRVCAPRPHGMPRLRLDMGAALGQRVGGDDEMIEGFHGTGR